MASAEACAATNQQPPAPWGPPGPQMRTYTGRPAATPRPQAPKCVRGGAPSNPDLPPENPIAPAAKDPIMQAGPLQNVPHTLPQALS